MNGPQQYIDNKNCFQSTTYIYDNVVTIKGLFNCGKG